MSGRNDEPPHSQTHEEQRAFLLSTAIPEVALGELFLHSSRSNNPKRKFEESSKGIQRTPLSVCTCHTIKTHPLVAGSTLRCFLLARRYTVLRPPRTFGTP